MSDALASSPDRRTALTHFAPALAAASTDSVQRIHRLLRPGEPLGRVRRQLLRATAVALALTPVLLALTPAVVALALGRLPGA